ncbi:DNA-directed RNA polymerase I subunit RPA49 [Octopus bimaculoides]|uniref:DNA-directed RNA polymerase I subunit RPA49 n=1 Tax=Octopus bimaculoides TaxID=37653 RepID=A0A0L8H6X4_OCTBM|nr:DNA-directed RNA polymerase I subunit RPA49 [Octopus bimaculoides]|eukprot:XP_014774911.1 PREDICTED: DNA-directed RNA polymerase I subunit RPA49-like [Octopus bimaculoides]
MFEVKEERPTLTLATFSHGKLKKKKHKKIKFLSYQQNQSYNGKRKRILVGKTDSICYVGDNFSGEKSNSSEMYKHYVGVLNKNTGKMQICDVEIFNLHPKVPEIQIKDEDISETLSLSYVEQQLRLTNAFGTVISRRQIDSYRKTVVDGTILDEAMDSILDQTLNKEDLPVEGAQPETPESSLLPPCNVDATSPEDVYNLSDIISPAEMGCLSEYSQDILNFKPENLESLKRDNVYCSCVLERLASLPPLGSAERETKACCLQYLEYMVEFMQMSSRTIKSKLFLNSFPPIVCKQFISKFLLFVRNSNGVLERQTTISLRDKLLLHILILLLIIDKFSLSFDNVQKELNIKTMKLQMLFNYIGCHIQKKKDNKNVYKVVVLKTPIKVMKPHKYSKAFL